MWLSGARGADRAASRWVQTMRPTPASATLMAGTDGRQVRLPDAVDEGPEPRRAASRQHGARGTAFSVAVATDPRSLRFAFTASSTTPGSLGTSLRRPGIVGRIQAMLEINIKAPFDIADKCLSSMREVGRGRWSTSRPWPHHDHPRTSAGYIEHHGLRTDEEMAVAGDVRHSAKGHFGTCTLGQVRLVQPHVVDSAANAKRDGCVPRPRFRVRRSRRRGAGDVVQCATLCPIW
jgi:hypothetical protein